MTRVLPLLTLVFPLLASLGAAAAEPTPTDWAQAVIAGKAVGWSPSLKQVAVREESLGTAMSDFRVVFLQPHGERADALEVMHEVYGEQGEDEYKSSHETWEAAIAEAGPKLATRLTEGAFMDLPRVPWAKRGALRGFKFTWKNNHLYAARGLNKCMTPGAAARAPFCNDLDVCSEEHVCQPCEVVP